MLGAFASTTPRLPEPRDPSLLTLPPLHPDPSGLPATTTSCHHGGVCACRMYRWQHAVCALVRLPSLHELRRAPFQPWHALDPRAFPHGMGAHGLPLRLPVHIWSASSLGLLQTKLLAHLWTCLCTDQCPHFSRSTTVGSCAWHMFHF